MILKSPAIPKVLLVRPGATDFDEQGRIKGSLDMPLSETGRKQVSTLAGELESLRVKTIFASPCESARETAEGLADGRDVKVKVIDAFRNVDHGLWHGKLLEDLKRNHPKVYRRGEDHPDDICPPGGESVAEARDRVHKSLRRVLRKAGREMVAIVIPDPMGQIVRSVLRNEELASFWKSETDAAGWEVIEPAAEAVS